MADTEILKKKKKKGYLLLASEFNNMEIGETMASEDSFLIGRSIDMSLAQMMDDPKMQNVKIRFKIKEIKDGKGYGEVYEYMMLPTYVKRVVKPAKEKVEDSFVLLTKDNIKVRIKPIMLTKAKTQQSVLANLKLKTREFFSEYCKNNDYSKFLHDLTMHFLQKELKGILNKVYPLSICEIRLMQKL